MSDYIDITILNSKDTEGVSFCMNYLMEGWEVSETFAWNKLNECLQQVNNSFCLTAQIAGKTVGMVLYNHDTGFNLPEVHHWISGLYIDPAYRNPPVMLKTMVALRKTLRERNISHVHCGVDEHNTTLQSFYKKLGFTRTDIPQQENAGHLYDIVELAI